VRIVKSGEHVAVHESAGAAEHLSPLDGVRFGQPSIESLDKRLRDFFQALIQ
jgi:hypothetical protein